MSFWDASSHWLIYTMVIIGILYVLGFAFVSIRKSWKRALEIGYTKEKLMTVVKASASTTVVPALAIVIGFFGLAAMLGIPWAWWRLSVIGSVAYEIMAADMALSAANIELASATVNDFVLMMFVMTIGILGGVVASLFISKKIQTGAFKRVSTDPKWGALSNSVFIMTILVVFLVPIFLSLGVDLLTLLTSAGISLLLIFIIKKTGATWLNNFVLAISMLGAMASSVLWTALLN